MALLYRASFITLAKRNNRNARIARRSKLNARKNGSIASKSTTPKKLDANAKPPLRSRIRYSIVKIETIAISAYRSADRVDSDRSGNVSIENKTRETQMRTCMAASKYFMFWLDLRATCGWVEPPAWEVVRGV